MQRFIRYIKEMIARFRGAKHDDIINWSMPTCENNVLSRFAILEKAYYEQENSNHCKEVRACTGKETMHVQGNYSVEGHNAGEAEKSYFGELELKKLHGKLYKAFWRIGFGQQVQKGMGLLVDDKLALDFYYLEEGQRYYGMVIYTVVGNNLLKGYWIEPGVKGVGFEECSFKNSL